MDLRNLPNLVANVLLEIADDLDGTMVDHERVYGSTVTGRALRLASNSLVVASMPWIVADFATGGPGRRNESGYWSEMGTDEDDVTLQRG